MNTLHHTRSRGFTLIELMIVLVIVAILTAIAYPSYTQHVVKTRRADGQSALMHAYALMERYYAENNTFATATINTGTAATDIISGGPTNGQEPSPEGFYNISIQAQNANSFTLQAVPTGTQATEDDTCATLTINSLGEKGQTGSGDVGDCWR